MAFQKRHSSENSPQAAHPILLEDRPLITPNPAVTSLVSGHFHQRGQYSAYRPRGTPDWLLIYTVTGLGRFGFAGGQIIAHPGDAVLLRPGCPHDYGLEPTLRRWDLLWTHFHPRPHWLEWLDWPEEAPGLMRLRNADPAGRRRIRRRMDQMHQLSSGFARRREQLAMNALEEVLLWCDAINPRSEQSHIDSRVRGAMDFICRHQAEKLTLALIATASGLSVSRLAHLFRRQTQTTPQRFLELQRIARAHQLLELTSMSVKEIAAKVGFDNQFYFTLRFKRHIGRSPTQYRKTLSPR